jgi:hypothetical protein
MDQLVHHHRTGPVGIGLQGTFGYSILEVSSDSTESEGLVLSFAVSDKGWFTKGVIVGSIGLHFDTKLAHEGFKLMFGLQGFTDPERDLVTSEGKPGGMINEDSTTCISYGMIFFSKRMSQSTWGSTDILIDGHTFAWLQIIAANGHLHLRLVMNSRRA